MTGERRDGIRAVKIDVRGRVQGVGFRPFIYRLAQTHGVAGWVRNTDGGVDIHAEGEPATIEKFVAEIRTTAPGAAIIQSVKCTSADIEGSSSFEIVRTRARSRPTVHVTPDLAVCDRCLEEMRDPADRRFRYAYLNCTECGPRFSIIESLPYDRSSTTMRSWRMCTRCADEYESPMDRRFHAQPVACPECGPSYALVDRDGSVRYRGFDAIQEASERLRSGEILAVKGLGGYHLACNALDGKAVAALRERKYRKEKPFALMVKDCSTADGLVFLGDTGREALESTARPIVVAPARVRIEGVAPDVDDLGVMLPYTPVHHLLFDADAPAMLVMTSGNRSSEPIAFKDDDAFDRLSGIADAFLVGERAIARRVEDSVVRVDGHACSMLRRSRGFAPSPVAVLPVDGPILAVGADLKNAVALVVEGQVYVSQHIGDLEYFDALEAFRATVTDLLAMYEVNARDCLIAHDAHPHYASTIEALGMEGRHRSVQHHAAHIASVVAERGAWNRRVVGLAFDGTGYGPDGSIWGGEVFVGSLSDGLVRRAHLREAFLVGGDAAARHPVQAAAGFVHALDDFPDLSRPPFLFPDQYHLAQRMLGNDVRVFRTTSAGRLFDAAAALVGFTRPITFEGQAAIWLEQLAGRSTTQQAYAFPGLDYAPLLQAVVDDRVKGRPAADIARSFHLGLARGLAETAVGVAEEFEVDVLVLSGGVFQNELLVASVMESVFERTGGALGIWVNQIVPANDGGISLGQAAMAALAIMEE